MDERVRGVDASSIDFVRSAVRVLRKLEPTHDPEIQFRCLTSAVPYLYAHAELNTALLAANGMVVIGRQTGRDDLARKGFNFLGIIDKTSGNFGDAVVHFQRALALAQEIGDVRGEISVLGNLAGTFVEAALYREALPCFDRADSLCKQFSGTADREIIEAQGMSLVNRSALYVRLGDVHNAYRAAQQSLAYWLEPETLNECVSRTLRSAHYVYLSLELGKTEEASEHAEACRSYSARNPTAPSVFFAKIASGLLQIATGNPAYGLQLLQAARREAGSLERTPLMADAWISLAWAYEQLHRPEDALNCIQALRQHVIENRGRAVTVLLARASDVQDEEAFELMALNYREARLKSEISNNAKLGAEMDLLERLAMAATLRDDPSGLHGWRVARLSALLAEKIGWNPRECWTLENGARLHDIGKSALPDHILLSRETLDEAQRDLVNAHSAIGRALLSNTRSTEVADAADIAFYHHERWDGSGYPKGLLGERIPINARIVAVADVFDALTHGRPYAERWPIEKAIAELQAQSGHQFDPAIVRVFTELIAGLRAKHPDLDAFLTAGAASSPFIAARREIQKMVVRIQ